MNFVKTISSVSTKGRRIVKFLRYGLKDVQTSYEAMPYGIDSSPIKDMIALYGPTAQDGKTVIIGYINVNQIAKPGEFRTFATDANGVQKFYTHMKDDGTMEVGGKTKHMTRYEGLETAFNDFKSDMNAFITKYNAHTHAAPGGATGPPTPTASPTAADITGAKINEIKTL